MAVQFIGIRRDFGGRYAAEWDIDTGSGICGWIVFVFIFRNHCG